MATETPSAGPGEQDAHQKHVTLAAEQGSAEETRSVKPVSRFTRWYRSPLFNVIIVGLISFTQPGIWNALNTGIWLGLRELGQLIGSSIQLSMNVKSGQRGRVGYTTYLVLIALQCLGLPLALLISPPQKVIRPDGRRLPDPTKNKAITGEFRKWWKLLRTRQFCLLIPILVGFNWNNTYLGIYLVRYFSVRSRTLASLCSGIAATTANIFWGWFYDLKYFSRPQLAKITWFFFAITMVSLFGWQFAMEKEYSTSETPVTLDWDLPGFGRGPE
ncbi:hypothetical protein HYQ44_020405 [Verticillium longisporum]|nr:hypothetical protein HYQ44_020405 [Verticillium longisporum]